MSTITRNNLGGGVVRGGALDKLSTSSVNKSLSKSTSSKISSIKQTSTRRGSTGAVNSPKYNAGVPGRVRVAVRLRPRNGEEMVADADFADCVELQPELKRLKLQKNNWDSDTYEFDEVLTEFSSQKRVYEVVAKPVVESVLDGYNGTIMAYGQTGTGKTYTLGRLGEEDTADRGIMVRAMEDILTEISLETDSIHVSYFQLYMETIQDLLDPSNDNIAIHEDPKTGDVSLPGATCVEIHDQKSFMDLLLLGEAHRFAANTKLNTESSRSHAILMVHVKRSVKGKDSVFSNENGSISHNSRILKAPIVRRSKLVIVDLAGSERIHKSGSEAHTLEEAKSINLSLSALGKCINALAENSSHVPVRDSKLTRLLRDSFGGTARTSLVITIGPSPRHRGETTSTIMFGQRAMKVENMLKIKEEFDYKSLSRRLDIQLEKLTAENERQQKTFQDEIRRINSEAKNRIAEVERNYADALEKERLKFQKDYTQLVKKLEDQFKGNQEKNGNGRDRADEKSIAESRILSLSKELSEVKMFLQSETQLRQTAEYELAEVKDQLTHWKKAEGTGNFEILKLRKMLEEESDQKAKLEEEISALRSQLFQMSFKADETRRMLDNDGGERPPGHLGSLIPQDQEARDSHEKEVSMESIFEQVGLNKILSLLEAEDAAVRIHAVKVVANLAAEEANQEKIVQAGGLTSLLSLLKNSNDETIHRVAAGAIANLAMNEANQELIMSQGGISLLSKTAATAQDSQTLRMVAGAIANLCGNDKLQTKLRSEGGLKAMLSMVRCRHPDVLAQAARGIANFAKCESRASTQGTKKGRSFLIEDSLLPWIVQNANNEASPIRRHIELALCHLAQHGQNSFLISTLYFVAGITRSSKILIFFITEVNAKDMISEGALWELVRISRDCSREDIRALAYRIIANNSIFQTELKRLRVDYE